MNGTSDQAILVTGAAGLIGFHVAQRLLEAGRRVVGLDNLNNYCDPALKQAGSIFSTIVRVSASKGWIWPIA
jgi:nucleoside-diphosphate-sugar epimerase